MPKFRITKISKIILTQTVEADNDYEAKVIGEKVKSGWNIEPSEEEVLVEQVEG